jgi:hypothetical protein
MQNAVSTSVEVRVRIDELARELSAGHRAALSVAIPSISGYYAVSETRSRKIPWPRSSEPKSDREKLWLTGSKGRECPVRRPRHYTSRCSASILRRVRQSGTASTWAFCNWVRYSLPGSISAIGWAREYLNSFRPPETFPWKVINSFVNILGRPQ